MLLVSDYIEFECFKQVIQTMLANVEEWTGKVELMTAIL
jgi:hypothetical protein